MAKTIELAPVFGGSGREITYGRYCSSSSAEIARAGGVFDALRKLGCYRRTRLRNAERGLRGSPLSAVKPECRRDAINRGRPDRERGAPTPAARAPLPPR